MRLFDEENLDHLELTTETLAPALVDLLAMDRHIQKLSQKYERLHDQIDGRFRRMREQGFDGDFDPVAGLREDADDIRFAIDGRRKAFDGAVEKLSKEDRAVYDAAVEDIDECAREARADARTRWYESGCPQ